MRDISEYEKLSTVQYAVKLYSYSYNWTVPFSSFFILEHVDVKRECGPMLAQASNYNGTFLEQS